MGQDTFYFQVAGIKPGLAGTDHKMLPFCCSSGSEKHSVREEPTHHPFQAACGGEAKDD